MYIYTTKFITTIFGPNITWKILNMSSVGIRNNQSIRQRKMSKDGTGRGILCWDTIKSIFAVLGFSTLLWCSVILIMNVTYATWYVFTTGISYTVLGDFYYAPSVLILSGIFVFSIYCESEKIKKRIVATGVNYFTSYVATYFIVVKEDITLGLKRTWRNIKSIKEGIQEDPLANTDGLLWAIAALSSVIGIFSIYKLIKWYTTGISKRELEQTNQIAPIVAPAAIDMMQTDGVKIATDDDQFVPQAGKPIIANKIDNKVFDRIIIFILAIVALVVHQDLTKYAYYIKHWDVIKKITDGYIYVCETFLTKFDWLPKIQFPLQPFVKEKQKCRNYGKRRDCIADELDDTNYCSECSERNQQIILGLSKVDADSIDYVTKNFETLKIKLLLDCDHLFNQASGVGAQRVPDWFLKAPIEVQNLFADKLNFQLDKFLKGDFITFNMKGSKEGSPKFFQFSGNAFMFGKKLTQQLKDSKTTTKEILQTLKGKQGNVEEACKKLQIDTSAPTNDTVPPVSRRPTPKSGLGFSQTNIVCISDSEVSDNTTVDECKTSHSDDSHDSRSLMLEALTPEQIQLSVTEAKRKLDYEQVEVQLYIAKGWKQICEYAEKDKQTLAELSNELYPGSTEKIHENVVRFSNDITDKRKLFYNWLEDVSVSPRLDNRTTLIVRDLIMDMEERPKDYFGEEQVTFEEIMEVYCSSIDKNYIAIPSYLQYLNINYYKVKSEQLQHKIESNPFGKKFISLVNDWWLLAIVALFACYVAYKIISRFIGNTSAIEDSTEFARPGYCCDDTDSGKLVTDKNQITQTGVILEQHMFPSHVSAETLESGLIYITENINDNPVALVISQDALIKKDHTDLESKGNKHRQGKHFRERIIAQQRDRVDNAKDYVGVTDLKMLLADQRKTDPQTMYAAYEKDKFIEAASKGDIQITIKYVGDVDPAAGKYGTIVGTADNLAQAKKKINDLCKNGIRDPEDFILYPANRLTRKGLWQDYNPMIKWVVRKYPAEFYPAMNLLNQHAPIGKGVYESMLKAYKANKFVFDPKERDMISKDAFEVELFSYKYNPKIGKYESNQAIRALPNPDDYVSSLVNNVDDQAVSEISNAMTQDIRYANGPKHTALQHESKKILPRPSNSINDILNPNNLTIDECENTLDKQTKYDRAKAIIYSIKDPAKMSYINKIDKLGRDYDKDLDNLIEGAKKLFPVSKDDRIIDLEAVNPNKPYQYHGVSACSILAVGIVEKGIFILLAHTVWTGQTLVTTKHTFIDMTTKENLLDKYDYYVCHPLIDKRTKIRSLDLLPPDDNRDICRFTIENQADFLTLIKNSFSKENGEPVKMVETKAVEDHEIYMYTYDDHKKLRSTVGKIVKFEPNGTAVCKFQSQRGDSGSGIFDKHGRLVGIHMGQAGAIDDKVIVTLDPKLMMMLRSNEPLIDSSKKLVA